MTTAITPVNQIMSQLECPAMKNELRKALPISRCDPDRMLRIVRSLLQTKTDLSKCKPKSIVAAVVECFQLGLEPGGLQQAYFVPFKDHCQLIPGYRGFMELARRSGEIERFSYGVVRDGDFFEYRYGTDQFLNHVPKPGSQGQIIHAYALAKHRNVDQYTFIVIDRAEIEKTKGRSPAAEKGPWGTDYDKMAMKTAIRRLSPLLPQCVELQRAATLQDQAESGEKQVFSTSFDGIIDAEAEAVEEIHDKAKALRERTAAAKKTQESQPQPVEEDAPPAETDESIGAVAEPAPADAPAPPARVALAGLAELGEGEHFATDGVIRAIRERKSKDGTKAWIEIDVTNGPVNPVTFTYWHTRPAWLKPDIQVNVIDGFVGKPFKGVRQYTISTMEPIE